MLSTAEIAIIGLIISNGTLLVNAIINKRKSKSENDKIRYEATGIGLTNEIKLTEYYRQELDKIIAENVEIRNELRESRLKNEEFQLIIQNQQRQINELKAEVSKLKATNT